MLVQMFMIVFDSILDVAPNNRMGVTLLPSKPVNVTQNFYLNIYRFQLLILCKKIYC